MDQTSAATIVRSFLTLVTSGSVRDAYDQYIHPDFVHHNQYFPGDRASLLAGMEENAKNFPHKQFTIQKMLAEGDTVMTLSHLRLTESLPDMAVVHICRIADGKIIEMWDVGQQLAKDSPNENGAF